MSDRPALIYVYDGSFEGLLCCVYESIRCKEVPTEIVSADGTMQLSMFGSKTVETNSEIAVKIYDSIKEKISPLAADEVKICYLSDTKGKELFILRFLLKGYHFGRSVLSRHADPDVMGVLNATRQVRNEAHHITGFLRFSTTEDGMLAVIEPRSQVLSLISGHFIDRFPEENFLIHDKSHKQALLYRNGCASVIDADCVLENETSSEEMLYRNLFDLFHKTIAIKERVNLKRQMSFMPKRYWSHMPEMSGKAGGVLSAGEGAEQSLMVI